MKRWFLETFFGRELKQIRAVAHREGEYNYRKQITEERQKDRCFELEKFAKDAVIFISNEHENVGVGFIEDFEYFNGSVFPVPVIKDYVSGKTLLVMGKVYRFTQQRLHAFANMTPEERVSIVFSNCFGGECVTFTTKITSEKDLLTYQQIDEILDNSDFYDRMEELTKLKNTDQ